jgi:hypothetical protein
MLDDLVSDIVTSTGVKKGLRTTAEKDISVKDQKLQVPGHVQMSKWHF